MTSGRMEKVNAAVKTRVAEILEHELHDPRIGFVTVTRAKVSADLRHATVYFSLLEGHGSPAETQAGLSSARGYIRRLLAGRLRLKMIPEISFRHDPSVAENIRITRLLSEIRRKEPEE